MRKKLFQLLVLIFIVLSLGACGGGGGGGSDTSGGSGDGGDNGGGTPPPPPPPPPVSGMTMACVEGAGHQCSGSSIIRRENGVALTRSGVQVYGKSTVDGITDASGLTPGSEGKADIRLRKNGASVSDPALLLSDIGISWDGRNERPVIIETFDPTQGRNELASDGSIVNVILPPVTDLEFYDYATLFRSATQSHYANNRYFPRSEPSRCDEGSTFCPAAETEGMTMASTGDWQDGGSTPSHAVALRYHEDGDIHAGNGLPDADGNPTFLDGSTGPGVPFPGAKGERSLENRSYRYANLAAWSTKDTVDIAQWLEDFNRTEHNQKRLGMIAFGDVTEPADVPTGGSVSYSGIVHGWYAADSMTAESTFTGDAAVTVDFATRTVTVTVQGLPTGALTVTSTLGTLSADTANYLTGAVDDAAWNGGLSGRLFGPVSASAVAPPEVAGAFSLTGKGGSAAAIGGFIARRQ